MRMIVPRVTGIRPTTKTRERNYPVIGGRLAVTKPLLKSLSVGRGDAAYLNSSSAEANINNQSRICSGRVGAGSQGLLHSPHFRPELSSLVSGAMDVRKEFL